MNILIIASSKRIGLTYHLTNLSLGLRQRGHNVAVVHSDGEQQIGLINLLKKADIPTYVLPKIDEFSLKRLKFNAIQLREIIDRNNIDVIHANGLSHLLYAYFGKRISKSKPALVMSVHSYFHGEPYANTYLIVECILLNLLADLVLPVSNMVGNVLVKSGLSPRKIMVVHNALDLKTFDKAPIKKNCSRVQTIINEISSKPTVISMSSQLVPRKGLIYLLRAIKYVKSKYPDVRVVITGSGPLMKKLKKMASSLQIENNVIFTGYLRHEYVLQLLKSANVAVVTSLSETFCHAMIEPLAAGVPIITTPVGVAPEIIKYSIGLIIPKKDSREISRAIIWMLDNPDKAREIGIKGRKLVEKLFSMEKIVNDLERAYSLAICKCS